MEQVNSPKYPRVGIGAIILNEKNEILLVLRKKSPEANKWSIPGGKVESMETTEQAVLRGQRRSQSRCRY